MKKICFVTTTALTLRTFVLEIAAYLHEHSDYEITFICDDDPAFAAVLPDYIRFIPVPMRRGINIRGFGTIRIFKRIFREHRFDIVQYSTPNAALYASVAARSVGVPIRLYGQWGIRYVGFTGLKRALFKMIEKYVCKHSTVIRSVSPGNLAFAESEGLYPVGKSKVLGRGGTVGVDLAEYPLDQKAAMRADIRARYGLADRLVFGFSGRLSRDKGGNELLAAFRDLSAVRPELSLLIVGPDETDRDMEPSLVEWARASDRVIFTGLIPKADMPCHYAAMDVLVHPTYREGFGLVLQEGAAMGLAVLTTRVLGASEVLVDGESCLLCESRDTDSLRTAMERLCDPSLAGALGHAARAFAEEHYDRQVMLTRLFADYEQIWEQYHA